MSPISGVGKPTATLRRAIIPHDKKAKKRKTAVSPSTDSDSDASCDEAAYEKFIEQSSDKGKLKSSNSDWNTCHVELRKALEQDGTLDRYGIQHLSLWTDLIQDGKVSGAHEEPDWRKYLNVVHVEPLPKRGMGLVRAKGQNDVLTTFLMQQEMRREEERENEKRRQRQEELLRQERQEDRKLEKQQASSMQALILHALSPRPQFGDGLSTCSSTQLSREIPTLNQGQCMLPTRRQIKYNTWSPPSCSFSSPESIRETPSNGNSPVSSTIESDDSEPFDYEEWVKEQIAICRRI